MDNLESKSVDQLLSQYDFKVVPQYKSRGLTCTVCGRLMTDAYQTYCGCKYCRQCIIGHLDGVDEYCRGGNSACREKPVVLDLNVTSSPALNRKISKSKVICPYESCGAIIELCEMEAHMELCVHKPMECPYSAIGCACGMTSKKNMESHLHTAIFAHSQLVVESIKEQRARFDVSLEDAVNERIKCDEDQRNESIMKNKEINEMRSQAEREKSEASSREDAARVAKVEEDLRVLVENGESKRMRGELETLRTEVERVKENNARLETRNKVIEGCAERAAKANDVRVDALSRTIDSLNIRRDREGAVGELWFTLDRMAERMAERGGRVDSPHLYSHVNGYKLRIRMETSYCSRYGGRAYLCVSSVVCRGEYDDVLPWPCRFALSVAGVHKHTKQLYVTRIIEYGSNTDNQYSMRPIDADNPPYGWFSLVHSDIRSSGVIIDDSLLFHVLVAR